MIAIFSQICCLVTFIIGSIKCFSLEKKVGTILVLILISPPMLYIYSIVIDTLIVLGVTEKAGNSELLLVISNHFVWVLLVVLTLIFMQIYSGFVGRFARSKMASFLYTLLSLMCLGFNYKLGNTVLDILLIGVGAVIANVIFMKSILPDFCSLRYSNEEYSSSTLFLLPLVALLFYLFRAGVSFFLQFEGVDLEKWDFTITLAEIILSYIVLIYLQISAKIILNNLHKADEKQIMAMECLNSLVSAIEQKDRYTNGHSRRVAEYSKRLAKHLEYSDRDAQKVYDIALLHDVGKIGIPDAILTKNGKLTDEEYAVIRQHPAMGADILKQLESIPQLSEGAAYHHERWDGKGYPYGLKGDEIPKIARIISVADAYDAMTSARSYRQAMEQSAVREEIRKNIGTQFSPIEGAAMLELMDADTEYKMCEGGMRKQIEAGADS